MSFANDFDLSSLPLSHLGNTSFNTVLYKLSHGPLIYDTERLKSLLLNLADHSKSSDFYTRQLDPDGNFLFCSTSSNYFVEDEIDAKIFTEIFL